MDRYQRQFVREAKSDISELIAQCEAMPAHDWANPPAIESIPHDQLGARADIDSFENEAEAEIIIRSSVGGSASLAFFIPYLWRHRH
ncbi:hypothetical protein [Frondihabitans australicus]|uniref:Uncharacterized protein n=1 Tax=Frondihabitans australicus TaxID=386892 RepID=A0A495IN79_9MICO|nr:hypothetical protein [Frondihabitans australicus]RKR76575.1 hypothetical protein C8E83_3752 [Frondihabitans australicus]